MPKKATLPREGWTYVNLPKELAEQIDELVNAQEHGYRSRSEFVSDAVRRFLEHLYAEKSLRKGKSRISQRRLETNHPRTKSRLSDQHRILNGKRA
jgi:metal-responsive CopG/Arc/MetJ family transcriptional regulator